MVMELAVDFEQGHCLLFVTGSMVLLLAIWLVIESLLSFRRLSSGRQR